MKHLSLHARFCIALAVTAFAGVLVLGAYGYFAEREIVESDLEDPILAEMVQSAEHFQVVLREQIADMKGMSTGSIIRSFLEAREHGDGDPEFHMPAAFWRSLLLDLFTESLRSNSHYFKLGYVDDSGDEIRCLRRGDGRIEVEVLAVRENVTENTYYFESFKLPRDSIYVSAVHLDQENGRIEIPRRQVVRLGIPVFDTGGQRCGIITSSIDATLMFHQEILLRRYKGSVAFIIDQDGFYVHHTDVGKEYGDPGNLNTGESLNRDFPSIALQVMQRMRVANSADTGSCGAEHVYSDKGDVLFFHPVISPGEPCRYWVVGRLFPGEFLSAPLRQWTKASAVAALLAAFLAVLFSLPVAARLTRPLRELAGAARAIRDGDFAQRVKVTSSDEVGVLAGAFNDMALGLRESERRFRDLFENTPIPIRVEDFSQVKAYLDQLKDEFEGGLEGYLERHPETLSTCAGLVKVLDVNLATLALYRAADKRELMKDIERTFVSESYEAFGRQLAAVWNGERRIELDTALKTLSGEKREVSILWQVAPGCEVTFSRILVTFLDITERKKTDRLLAEQRRMMQRRQQELTALHSIGTAVTSTLDLKEILDTIVSNVAHLAGQKIQGDDYFEKYSTHSVAGTVSGKGELLVTALLINPATGELEACVASAGGGDKCGLYLPEQDRKNGPAAWVAMNKEPLMIADIRQDGRFAFEDAAFAAKIISYLGLPIVSRGKVIGVLNLTSSVRCELTKEDIGFLQTLCSSSGAVIENAMIYREIQQRAESLAGEIAVQKQYAENVINTITDGVYTMDTDMRIVSWNHKAEAIIGFTAREVIGRKGCEVLKLVDGSGSPLCIPEKSPAELVRETGKPVSVEEVFVLSKDGRRVTLAASTAPLFDEKNRLTGVVEVFRDVSREHELLEGIQRAKEAAEAASRAKSTFLANMSHEIRTPMNAILGFSQLLQRDPRLSAAQREHVDTINRNGEHLLALINDVLEMSKIEAGRSTLHPVAFDLRTLIRDIETMFRLRTDARGVSLIVDIAPDVPRYAVMDEGKLRQILINLLGNAVKFTEQGWIALRVRCSSESEKLMRLIAEVEDTGPGIDEADAARLFRHFEQAGAGVRSGGGTGLGLVISRGFSRLMGGDIRIESSPGKGSIFHLEVQMTRGEGDTVPAKKVKQRVVGLRNSERALRVLIVDDKEDNRAILKGLLAPLGFEAREAANGREAIAEAEKWEPDVIFMDIRMPVMDGFEATRHIKGTQKGRDTPIIAVTASTFEDGRKQALDAGIDGYVRKPFKEDELFEALRSSLKVEYVYEERAPAVNEEETPAGAAVNPGLLANLPRSLLRDLHGATRRGDLDELMELIEEAAGRSRQAADYLRRLAADFEYDTLLKITEGTEG